MTSNTNTKNETQAQTTTPGQKQDAGMSNQKTDLAGNKVEPLKKDAQGNDVKQTEGAAESTPAKTGSDKR